MPQKAVIGLGFGDEGKGLVTNYLCSNTNFPLVVRFSGGHQAGHTVVNDGVRHVFSQFGSGTLQGVPTYWSEYCTFDPVGFVRELNDLNKKMDIDNVKIYINSQCPVTTIYDKYANVQHEKEHSHGSVGVGFGKTLERHEKLKFVFADLFNDTVCQMKLDAIADYYGFEKRDLEEFMYAVENIDAGLFDGGVEMVEEMPYKDKDSNIYRPIFEGSQGLLLDKDYGFFPHVTRSNVGSKRLWLLPPSHNMERWYVTRAYQTRHGNGPMTNEDIALELTNNKDETNVLHNYQGEFRVAPLDLDLLHYSLNCDRREIMEDDKDEYLVITCMDQIDEYKLTRDGELVDCGSVGDFLNTIGETLGFKREQIFLSSSPDSELKQW